MLKSYLLLGELSLTPQAVTAKYFNQLLLPIALLLRIHFTMFPAIFCF